LVLVGDQSVERSTAGIVRYRKCLCNIHGHWIKRARRDLVVPESETRRQIDLLALVAHRRGKCGEVAVERSGCGNEGSVLDAVGSQCGSLIAAEDAQLALV